jgi:opacity protein-like surface antigen
LEDELMKLLYPVAVFSAALVVSAVTATAQTPGPQAPAASGTRTTASPVVNLWYAGFVTGSATVKKTGAVAGGEAGVRAWHNVDVSLEVGWFQNAVSGDPLDKAQTLATFLQNTQGKSASSTVKMPVTYGTLNGRWVFESARRYRPYGVLGVGGARVSRNSEFALAGSDITGSLGQYGVALGGDLSGHSSHPALTAGVGVLIPYKKWYGDIGYRLTCVFTSGQSTNVNRLNIGFGARF